MALFWFGCQQRRKKEKVYRVGCVIPFVTTAQHITLLDNWISNFKAMHSTLMSWKYIYNTPEKWFRRDRKRELALPVNGVNDPALALQQSQRQQKQNTHRNNESYRIAAFCESRITFGSVSAPH